MDIGTTCNNIEKLEVKTKIIDEKEKGEIVDSYPVTVVKFQIRGTPGQFDRLLEAVAHNHSVSVEFTSPQYAFPLKAEMKETVPA